MFTFIIWHHKIKNKMSALGKDSHQHCPVYQFGLIRKFDVSKMRALCQWTIVTEQTGPKSLLDTQVI